MSKLEPKWNKNGTQLERLVRFCSNWALDRRPALLGEKSIFEPAMSELINSDIFGNVQIDTKSTQMEHLCRF